MKTTFGIRRLLPVLLATASLAACTSGAETDALADIIVATRAPLPEPTPGAIESEIIGAAEAAGLAGSQFLGLTTEQWINLGISLAILLGGYLLGFWLLRIAYDRITRQLPPEMIPEEAGSLGVQIRWLILVVALYLATAHLTLLGPWLRRLLLDIYFVVGMLLLAVVLWRALILAVKIYQRRIADPERLTELRPVLILLTRLGQIVLVVVIATIIMSHFGISVAAVSAVVGISGLALSLAARDTIADAIAGMIILIDRPFRVGDRIEIERVNTWGDVVQIGLRSTRIRTRDNRLVIVPNSIIGSNQIINYSYPDPRYRIQVRVAIPYGVDIEWVRRIMVETVRQVDGVLPDMAVEALYEEMGDSAMIFLVRWWIESFVDTRRMYDKVNTALQVALDASGVVAPFPIQTVILKQEGAAEDAAKG